MQQKQRRKIIVFVVIGILVCLGFAGAQRGLDYWESRALARLTSRLGVEPSWEAYEDYLDHAFGTGMTREEVQRMATRIGPFVAEPKSSGSGETISFDFTAMGFPPLMSREHAWLVVDYDDKGLVSDIYRYDPNEW
jgi:hypothetical protein